MRKTRYGIPLYEYAKWESQKERTDKKEQKNILKNNDGKLSNEIHASTHSTNDKIKAKKSVLKLIKVKLLKAKDKTEF